MLNKITYFIFLVRMQSIKTHSSKKQRQTGRKKGFSELFNGIKRRIETAMQSDDKSQK